MATEENKAQQGGAVAAAGSTKSLDGLSKEARTILAYMTVYPQPLTSAWPLAIELDIKISRLYPALQELVDRGLITESSAPTSATSLLPRRNYAIKDPIWCRDQLAALDADLLNDMHGQELVKQAHRS